MRLGVLSDTHDQQDRTRLAVQLLREEGAEVLIHCGDMTGPEMLTVLVGLPCYFVFGNHDADNVPYLQRAAAETGAICLGWGGTVQLGGKRVGITHGHMNTDIRCVLAERPDYLLSGHSHMHGDLRDGFTRRINPGALYEAAKFTVAMLDLASDEVRYLTIGNE